MLDGDPPRLEPLNVQAKLRLLVELIDDLDQIEDMAPRIAGHVAASRLPIAASTRPGA